MPEPPEMFLDDPAAHARLAIERGAAQEANPAGAASYAAPIVSLAGRASNRVPRNASGKKKIFGLHGPDIVELLLSSDKFFPCVKLRRTRASFGRFDCYSMLFFSCCHL